MENGSEPKPSAREIAQRIASELAAQVTSRSYNAAYSSKPEEPTRRRLEREENRTAVTTASAPPAPANSTAYVSMLPYAYTNSDVAQLFSQFGKLARVTILRDKETRKSRGVAFIQFARGDDCARAVEEMNGLELEGFTLACSMSRDNGRSHEFARKRKYTVTPAGASRCFECGEFGHFSYNCPKNVLGDRERPVTRSNLKRKKKKGYEVSERGHYFNDEGVVDLLAPPTDTRDDISLSLLAYSAATDSTEAGGVKEQTRKKRAIGRYFSDESGSDED